MDRRYTILAILVIVAALGLLILPDRIDNKVISPEKLLVSIDDPARFLSTDLITERIIGGDPSLQLIDVRPAEEFRQFALPGAVNIPLDSLLSLQWKEIMHQPGKDKVFYSNADIEADQAWQIGKRNSIDRIFVMKGGLNFWFSTIMKVEEPPVTAGTNAIDLYHFRLAAKQYFSGENSNPSSDLSAKNANPKAEEKVVVKKVAKPSAGGGC